MVPILPVAPRLLDDPGAGVVAVRSFREVLRELTFGIVAPAAILIDHHVAGAHEMRRHLCPRHRLGHAGLDLRARALALAVGRPLQDDRKRRLDRAVHRRPGGRRPLRDESRRASRTITFRCTTTSSARISTAGAVEAVRVAPASCHLSNSCEGRHEVFAAVGGVGDVRLRGPIDLRPEQRDHADIVHADPGRFLQQGRCASRGSNSAVASFIFASNVALE